jgi:hypothetical protein
MGRYEVESVGMDRYTHSTDLEAWLSHEDGVWYSGINIFATCCDRSLSRTTIA